MVNAIPRYECVPSEEVTYPPQGCRPPQLYKYPKIKTPVKWLFLGWNPPKPVGGFWSDDEDNLRSVLHGILNELGQIQASCPDKAFLEEFLEKGFYLIHTVKCWTEAKIPGFGQGAKEGKDKKKNVGMPLIKSCVRTHLGKELQDLKPRKICALGKVPFLGLSELFPALSKAGATPTQGKIFLPENSSIPWPFLYTCFPPQPLPIKVHGTECRKPARDIVRDHFREFLQS